ncbi:DinB family protein [Tenacibaculum xiamenense]|uniref:DinB family protein n=1 Tax=Tenacibaculum xiamenense TaxID=1261553 RepID=UPI003894DEFF
MGKSNNKKDHEFLEYVYKLNEGRELIEAFELSLKDIDEINIDQLQKIGQRTYAEGKWTIHTILQHLIDWERVWCYRAIIFARHEGSIPDAHDQEIMAENSNANKRTIEDLLNELRIVRQSSIILFKSFSNELLETNCEFFEYEMPLSAIGLTIIAHQIHHINIINERYIPLDV